MKGYECEKNTALKDFSVQYIHPVNFYQIAVGAKGSVRTYKCLKLLLVTTQECSFPAGLIRTLKQQACNITIVIVKLKSSQNS